MTRNVRVPEELHRKGFSDLRRPEASDFLGFISAAAFYNRDKISVRKRWAYKLAVYCAQHFQENRVVVDSVGTRKAPPCCDCFGGALELIALLVGRDQGSCRTGSAPRQDAKQQHSADTSP
jgi:hypothetical protein